MNRTRGIGGASSGRVVTTAERRRILRYKGFATVASLAAIGAASFMAVPAFADGNAGTTQVERFDPTGAVFTCPGTDYTVLGGSVLSVFHDSFAANGSEHVTGTIAPTGVTLSDGTTATVYRLSGASWFGANFNVVNGKYEFTDTEFFNILGPSGGVVAKVAGVEHMSSGGSNFSFTFGQCEPPQD
jgi:hypothetical protein